MAQCIPPGNTESTIITGSGNDTIIGGVSGPITINAGDDTISGGTGHTTVNAGEGTHHVSGDAGGASIRTGTGAVEQRRQ